MWWPTAACGFGTSWRIALPNPRAWVEPLLHQLRHGGEAGMLQTLQNLPAWCAQRRQGQPPTVEKEIHCFEQQREHLQYEARAAEGCPVGSGAMESLCGQLQ